MTPKQRGQFSALTDEIFQIVRALRRLRRKAEALSALLGQDTADTDDFTPEEVDCLVQLNERMGFLQRYLDEIGPALCAPMAARVADPELRFNVNHTRSILRGGTAP